VLKIGAKLCEHPLIATPEKERILTLLNFSGQDKYNGKATR